MTDPLFWHRLQFGFTITYHYLFPQLTMGLALLIVALKGIGLRTGRPEWNDAARFWIRIFGLSFAMGVVTGIPMEFQFGTNWAQFSAKTGGVIGQTLAMEGIFAFFLESSFLALLSGASGGWGETKHFLAAVALWVGSWLSGYFIVATNAFMQHPVGHEIGPDGTFQLADLLGLPLQPLGDRAVRAHDDGRAWSPAPSRWRRSAPSGRCAASTATRRGSRSRPASSPASSPRSWWRCPPATSRGAWSPTTSRPPSPAWRGASRAGRARRSR